MDPISLIVTALASGAAAALKPTAENVVKDAYQGLKSIIRDRYAKASDGVEGLESRPDSAARKSVVEEDLREIDAAADRELLERAKAVLAAVQQHDPSAADAAAVDLEDIRTGASVNIEDIRSDGRAVRIRGADIGEDLNIKRIRSGGRARDEGS